MPPATFPIPHTSARALFAQDCTHDTHYLNCKGDLYTVLITGGNRVLMLKNGNVVAQSGPLFDHTASPPESSGVTGAGPSKSAQRATGSASTTSASRTPCVYVVSICCFTDDVLRIAVATTAGIFIFEFDDAGLLWQDTRPSTFWLTADRDGEDGVFGPGAPTASVGGVGSLTSHWSAVHGRGSQFQAPAGSPLGLRGTAGTTTGSSSPTTASPTRVDAQLEKHSGMAGRLRWRRVAFSLCPSPQRASTTSAANAGTGATARGSAAQMSAYRVGSLPAASSTASAYATTTKAGDGSCAKPVMIAPVRVAAPARASAVRAMDFVSEDALCVVLETETVLLMLGNSSAAANAPSSPCGAGSAAPASAAAAPRVADRVVWRSLGAYRSLAVCRVNHHIALALGHSSMVVFPSRILAADGQDSSSGLPGDDEGGRSSAAFATITSSFFTTNTVSGEGAVKFMPATVASAMRGMLSDSRSSSIVPTPAFSPTNPPISMPVLPGGVGGGVSANFSPASSPDGGANAGALRQPYITLAKQGLTASVGIYHITDMRWHHVSTHTLLCVTCSHPHKESSYMMLYTVQSLSATRRYTNVMEEHADGGWGLCRGGYDGDGVMDGGGSVAGSGIARRVPENLVQLVPAGVIALTYTSTAPSAGPTPCTGNTAFAAPDQPPQQTDPCTPAPSTLPVSPTATTTWNGAQPPPVAEMHTSLVPNFSRSAEANSMGSRMEFLHVEGDGTVRTSSYSFGRQKHASFAKQRAMGLACTELLQPLLHLYGSLVRVTVLPTWRTRPIELGHHTGKQPQAVEVQLNASRRYRLVLRFTSGVVLSVMVDLSAAVYRVESYLALGRASLLSLRPISPIPELNEEGVAAVKLAQTAVGTTTMLLVGLLGFPPPSSPPAGKPKRLLTASPSFLEENEVDVWRHTKSSKASRSSSASSATSTSRSCSMSPALAAGAAGAASHPLHPPSSTAAATTAPPGAAARTVWGVVLLQVEPSGLQARVLTIAPLSDVSVPGVTDAGAAEAPQQAGEAASVKEDAVAASSGNETAKAAQVAPASHASAAVSEEDVAHFIAEKCPEKLRFMPALLKATQQDAGKLLTQLITKYGPLENASTASQRNQEGGTASSAGTGAAAAAAAAAPAASAAPMSSTASLSPSVLSSGCVSEEGDVVLLLTAPCDHAGGCSGADATDTATRSSVAVVRIRPSCVETFAPVQKLVAAGSSQVPFLPVAADYVTLPFTLQEQWWPRGSPAAPPPSCASADARDICVAYRLCRRLSHRLKERKTVRCEVLSGGAAGTPPYVRVRSPLAPEGKGTTSLIPLQHLTLPDGAQGPSREAALQVEEVKGILQVNNDVVVGVLCRDVGFAARCATSSWLPLGTKATSTPSSLSVNVSSARAPGTLYLYGRPAVQSLAAAPDAAPASSANPAPPSSSFVLEARLTGVEVFYLSSSGEVVVLRRTINATDSTAPQELRFERWLRCFPGGDGDHNNEGNSSSSSSNDIPQKGASGDAASVTQAPLREETGNVYSYQQDTTWCPPCSHSRSPITGEPSSVTAVTTMEVAGAWEANVVGLSTAAKLTSSRIATRPVLYAMADNSFIHLRQVPLRGGGDVEWRTVDSAKRDDACDAGKNGISISEGVGEKGTSAALAGLPQYHPDAVMQLIGMARWTVLAKVLTLVLDAAKSALASTQPLSANNNSSSSGSVATASTSLAFLFSQPPDELARRLCTSAAARGFRDRPQVVQYDDALFRVTPPRLSAEALQDDTEATSTNAATGKVTPSTAAAASTVAHRLYDLTATCGSLFTELTEVLPQVTLTGLSSQEQLNLLCILQALRDTLPLSRSVDEAAARYLFFTRFMSLGRRLRLPNIDISAAGSAAAAIPGVPINSVLYFEVGRTATRTVSTAAYLWAAMSDSQSTLVSLLFDKTSAMYLDGSGGSAASAANLSTGEITWEQVEQSGAAFWLRSAADLRALADRVARHQYQRTKDLTACALMYCTARKVGTLAALAKAQNNPRLNAFFSRDFAHDEHHRAAASANAYAAISKNLPQYGAAFFLLAGDVRSAVQVLLQRCHDPFLALFVLRAAGEGAEGAPTPAAASEDAASQRCGKTPPPETLLQWYVRQRISEVDACGPLDMWETACLSWMDITPQTSPDVTLQRRIAALQRIAAHPTAHPEALCALRYARDGVAALAYRGDQFLSPAREVVCLLRLGRYCLAHRLYLNGYLHYRDAEGLLCGLRAEAAARRRGAVASGEGTSLGGWGQRDTQARRPPPPPKMAADFITGTLIFRGFDSDDDDDGAATTAASCGTAGSGGSVLNTAQGKAGAAVAGGGSAPFVLSDEADAAVQAEVQYAYTCIGAAGAAKPTTGSAATMAAASSTSYEDVLRRMLLCFTSASSFMSTSTVTPADGAETASAAAATAATTVVASTSSVAGASSPADSAHGPFQDLLTQLLRRLISDLPEGPQAGTDTAAVSSVLRASMSVGTASPAAEAEELLPLPEPQKTVGAASVVPTVSQSVPLATAAASPIIHATDAVGPVLNGSIREPIKCAVEGWFSLCVPLLHLLLGKVALQEANYFVLLSLLRIPVSTEGVLEAAEQAGMLHDVLKRAAASSPRSADAVSAGPSLFAGQPSQLYVPLVAFFMLLGRYVVRYYKEACEAEEAWQGGRASRTNRTSDAAAASDNAKGAGDANQSEDRVHQNMFEALMAAAAAAEHSGPRSGDSSPFSGAREGARRSASLFDGGDGSFTAMDGADDEDLLGGGSGGAAITDAAQVSFLLSCCQSQLQLRLLEHLRHLAHAELQAAVHTPTTQRAIDAGVLYSDPLSPAAQAMLIQRRILLSTMLLDVTAQWGALSEETMLRLYSALPHYAPGPLTDPNGTFLEVRVDVLRMRAVLVMLLAAPRGVTEAAALAATTESAVGNSASSANQPSVAPDNSHNSGKNGLHAMSTATTTWLEENTVLLLDLCTAQLELFWTLPSLALTQCRQLAAPTRAALRLLWRSTASHSSARRLLESMLRQLNEQPALSQRNHTAPLAAQPSLDSPLTRAATTWRAGIGQSPPERPSRTTYDGDGELSCPALSYLQLAWMRRHHTHALLRWLLLSITLDMGGHSGHRPLVTDRLILTQHSHSVTGVQFDLSSCDSVVCTTEAGTSVTHGFRELLAGDNEEALWSQSTERNLATAAFTLGLTAQQARLQLAAEHSEGVHTPAVVAALAAKAVLESRPRCAVAANAMPASHPHLPFFVARHRDGHLDLYPYASQECLASFCCALRHGQGNAVGGSGGAVFAGTTRANSGPGMWAAWGVGPSTAAAVPDVPAVPAASPSLCSNTLGSMPRMERHAVTPAAFSPNGYIIAVGLSDGSVAGWRFAAAAVESPPAFTFPQLFAPYGIRACTFCGDRSSLMAVVGLTREPHPHPRLRINGGAATTSSAAAAAPSLRPASLSTSFAMSPATQTGLPGARASSADFGELVGEVLILDTMLDEGAVTARCALPFVPSYAVYLTPLRAVLMVSSEGLMATYSVPAGRLAVIATTNVTSVLSALLGRSYAEDGANGGGMTGNTGSTTTNFTAATAAAATAGGADGAAVHVTCLAKSAYDPLVALGTSNGLVLLLHLRHISAATREAELRVRDEGEDVFVYYPPAAGGAAQSPSTGAGRRKFSAPLSTPTSATSRVAAEVAAPVMGTDFVRRLPAASVLAEATCMQMAPQLQSRSAVEDIVFSPSMLLAGLRDGKVMAAAIIAQAMRTHLTAGSNTSVDLLEVAQDRA